MTSPPRGPFDRKRPCDDGGANQRPRGDAVKVGHGETPNGKIIGPVETVWVRRPGTVRVMPHQNTDNDKVPEKGT